MLEGGLCSPVRRVLRHRLGTGEAGVARQDLLPVLADQYGRVLERGELRLVYDGGRLLLDYNGLILPINPRQSPRALRIGIAALRRGSRRPTPTCASSSAC